MRRWFSALYCLALLWPTLAFGQAAVLQGGNYVGGHVPIYSNPSFGQPIVTDGGGAAGGGPGVGLSELNITARGPGAGPYVGLGTGPLGTLACMQDNPSSTANYHYLCFSPNTQGGGLIAYGAAGTASQLPFNLNVNGTTYQFPFVLSGIVGPATSIIGDLACWNNIGGSLLKDCGSAFTLQGTGSGSTILQGSATASGTLTFPAATDTLIGKATTDTLTNKTYDTAGTGNVLKINGTTVNAVTGTGSTLVASVSPALTGTPTAPTAANGTSSTQLATAAFATTSVTSQAIHVQTFTVSGTYTPSANLIYAVIECWGGGGGGGGTGNSAASTAAGGGGGGAGSYSRKIASAATLLPNKTVTIGAGGLGGGAGANNGTIGGDTSVGSLCIGKGGIFGGGAAGNAGGTGAGGPGGVAGTGDFTGTGAPGTSVTNTGTTGAIIGSVGGSTSIGGGALSVATFNGATQGTAATGPGGGGGGGISANNAAAAGGGNGGAGYVIITEFCSQ